MEIDIFQVWSSDNPAPFSSAWFFFGSIVPSKVPSLLAPLFDDDETKLFSRRGYFLSGDCSEPCLS